MLPYQKKLNKILTNFLSADLPIESPYIRAREVKRVAIIAFSSNTSLCGAFNANVIKMLLQTVSEYRTLGQDNILIFPIGKKVEEAVKRMGFQPGEIPPTLSDKPTYQEASELADLLMKMYVAGEIDRVELIYHHFKSKEEVFDALCEKLFYETNPFKKAKKHKELNGLEKLKFVLKTSFDETEHRRLSIASMELLGSPAFLKKLIESNQELTPMYQELIEEGIQDGSIQTEHSKLLAELFVLLTNFWSIPTIYPMTSEEMWEKFLMIKEITDKLGLPIIDNDIVELCKKNS